MGRQWRRHDARGGERWPQGHLRHQVAPRLPLFRRQLRPALGVFEEFHPIRWAHARKFGESADALGALRKRQFVEGLQCLFHLCALGIRQRVERFLFFVRRQFKKPAELRGDFLALVFGQILPARLRGIARAAPRTGFQRSKNSCRDCGVSASH